MIWDDWRWCSLSIIFVSRLFSFAAASQQRPHFAAEQLILVFPIPHEKKKNDMGDFVKRNKVHSSVATILIQLIDWFNRNLSIVVILNLPIMFNFISNLIICKRYGAIVTSAKCIIEWRQ